jgi:hypothetical protein
VKGFFVVTPCNPLLAVVRLASALVQPSGAVSR